MAIFFYSFRDILPLFISMGYSILTFAKGEKCLKRRLLLFTKCFCCCVAEILTKCLKGSFIFERLKQSIEEMLKTFHNWMTFICQLVSAGSEVIDKLCTMSPHLLFKSCHNLKYFQHHFLFAKDRTQKLPCHRTK